MRAEAFTAGHRANVLTTLADMDAEWLLAHATQPQARGRWPDLLQAFERIESPRLGEVAVLLVEQGVVTRAALETFAQSQMGWEGREACLDALAAS